MIFTRHEYFMWTEIKGMDFTMWGFKKEYADFISKLINSVEFKIVEEDER